MKALKKVGIGLGIFVSLIVVTLAVAPFFINIDQYRPQILEIANENINGKLDIKKLSLSLWGKFEIQVDGISVKDASGKELVSVGQTFVGLPFSTVLSGSPRTTILLDQPDLFVVRDKKGKINLLSLVKESKGSAPTAAPKTEEKPAPKKEDGAPTDPAKTLEDAKVLGLIMAAALDFKLKDANLRFIDQAMDLDQKVNGFNFLLSDISMTKQMKLQIWSDIGTKFADLVTVNGPFKINGKIKPKFDKLTFKSVAMNMALDFGGLDIKVPGVFEKGSDVPTSIKFSLTASEKRVQLKKLKLKFHNAELEGSVLATELSAKGDQPAVPRIQFRLGSNPIDLSTWQNLLPPLREHGLKGSLKIAARANGKLDKLDYGADVDVIGFSANAPGLLANPVVNTSIRLVTDELKSLNVKVTAPETDLQIAMNMKGFEKPNINVSVTSNSINLDKILPPPPEEKEAPANQAKPATVSGKESGSGSKSGGSSSGAADAPKEVVDVDGQLDPIRNNEMLAGSKAKVSVRLSKFQGMKLDIRNIKVDLSLNNLKGSLDQFYMEIFGGSIDMSSAIDIKPARPTYDAKVKVSQLVLEQAVESQIESLKNTVLGKMSFSANGTGSSLNSDKMIKNLNFAGDFKIADASFATVDVAKMTSGAIDSGINGVVKKIPGMKKPKIGGVKGDASKYEHFKSDFTLKNGVFKAPNFEARSQQNKGIDLEGSTTADLINDKLDAQWFVVDTYNHTKARDIDVSVKGVTVKHILAEKGKPVSFPVVVGCKLSEPCYQFDKVAGHLAKIAQKNVEEQVLGGAKKKLMEELNKKKAMAKAALKKKQDEAKKLANKKKKALQKKLDKKKKAAKKKADKKKKAAKKKATKKAKDAVKNKFGL